MTSVIRPGSASALVALLGEVLLLVSPCLGTFHTINHSPNASSTVVVNTTRVSLNDDFSFQHIQERESEPPEHRILLNTPSSSSSHRTSNRYFKLGNTFGAGAQSNRPSHLNMNFGNTMVQGPSRFQHHGGNNMFHSQPMAPSPFFSISGDMLTRGQEVSYTAPDPLFQEPVNEVSYSSDNKVRFGEALDRDQSFVIEAPSQQEASIPQHFLSMLREPLSILVPSGLVSEGATFGQPKVLRVPITLRMMRLDRSASPFTASSSRTSQHQMASSQVVSPSHHIPIVLLNIPSDLLSLHHNSPFRLFNNR